MGFQVSLGECSVQGLGSRVLVEAGTGRGHFFSSFWGSRALFKVWGGRGSQHFWGPQNKNKLDRNSYCHVLLFFLFCLVFLMSRFFTYSLWSFFSFKCSKKLGKPKPNFRLHMSTPKY